MRPLPATATSDQRDRAAQPFLGVRTWIGDSLAGGMAKAGWGNGRDTEGRGKGDEDSVLKASDRWAGRTQSARTTEGQSIRRCKDRIGWRGGQLAKTPGEELEGEGTAS